MKHALQTYELERPGSQARNKSQKHCCSENNHDLQTCIAEKCVEQQDLHETTKSMMESMCRNSPTLRQKFTKSESENRSRIQLILQHIHNVCQ